MRTRLTVLLTVAAGLFALAACTPEEASNFHIYRTFGAAGDQAAVIAECESNMNPEAVSPGGGNHGLFQINNVHRAEFTRVTGQPWSAVYEPYWNTLYAKRLYDARGWQPWPTCKYQL